MPPTPRSVAICLICFASVALADDFKTIYGKEYKNATVSRVEPDGIMLVTKWGISKVYFTELPKEVQERYQYDPAKAAVYSREENAAQEQVRKQQEEVLRQQHEFVRAREQAQEREAPARQESALRLQAALQSQAEQQRQPQIPWALQQVQAIQARQTALEQEAELKRLQIAVQQANNRAQEAINRADQAKEDANRR